MALSHFAASKTSSDTGLQPIGVGKRHPWLAEKGFLNDHLHNIYLKSFDDSYEQKKLSLFKICSMKNINFFYHLFFQESQRKSKPFWVIASSLPFSM